MLTDPTVLRLADDLAIRDLVARFADVVNRGSAGELADVWHPDGEWVLPVLGTSKGLAAITATFTDLLARHERLVQIVGSGHATVDGDTAAGRWYQWEITLGIDGVTRSFLGVYDDDFVRTPDGWRFRRRTYHSLLRTVGEFDTTAVPWDGGGGGANDPS